MINMYWHENKMVDHSVYIYYASKANNVILHVNESFSLDEGLPVILEALEKVAGSQRARKVSITNCKGTKPVSSKTAIYSSSYSTNFYSTIIQ